MLDTTRSREVFEASQDYTVGLEEEFQILDPSTRSLAHRFGELNALAMEDEVLAESVAGDLIESEIEIRSGKGANFDAATASQRERRRVEDLELLFESDCVVLGGLEDLS